jgi:hypothetical protein
MKVNINIPLRTPNMSINMPPINGSIMLGKEYTEYRRLN